MTDEQEYPEVTNEAYARWLRAQRPPWLWFLDRSVLEQEQLACLGDTYIDGCLAAGAEVGTAAEDEESKVLRLAERVLEGRQVRPQQPPEPGELSMGGVTERREKKAQEQQDGKDGSRKLLGREPDAIGPDVQAIGPDVQAIGPDVQAGGEVPH
jgi:hypothetical protein